MFRFAHPEYLYLLIVIPVLIVGYVLVRLQQRRNLRKFGNPQLLRTLMIDPSTWRPVVKFSLMMVALTLAVFLIARPQFGTKQETVTRHGIEAIVAVDVSNSMLCEDVKPSRLSKSKMLVNKLIEQLDGDRMGLVAFAGTAVTLLPVTADNVSAKMFLDQLSPASVPMQGTCMAEAINRAVAGFSQNNDVGQALILITDAEDNEPGAIEAVKAAKERGIRCFVLAVGTEAGGLIPLGNGSYKKDLNGQVVTTKLNPEIGKQIAKAGDGVYIHVDQTSTAQALLEKEIRSMQQADFQSTVYSEYDEQFMGVALLLLLVFIVETIIMEKRNPIMQDLWHWLMRGNVVKGLLLFILFATSTTVSVRAQLSDRDHIRIGNRYFAKGQYHDAEISYQKAVDQRPSMEAYYNLANALAMQKQDSTADARFRDAAKCESPNRLKRSQIYHNMGDLYYASGLNQKRFGGSNAQEAFAGAVECFKQALRLDPSNNETRYNLAMAQWQMKNNQQNQQDQQGQNNQQNQQQDQQDDQQDEQDQDDQQQNQQDQQDKQQQEQQQQQDQSMDERTAEQLLNSAQQDEQRVQDKLQQASPSKRSLEKDW